MNIVEKLINDEKRIRAEWDKFQREIVTLKNKGLGPKAQREFEQKAQQSVRNFHLQAGILGSFLFILEGLAKHRVNYPLVARVKEINDLLNNIDMAFGDFDKTKLSPRVECDVFIAYNRTRKIYLNSGYPESVLPDTLEMKKVCSNGKKLNQRIREKVNSLLPAYAQQKASR